MKSLIIKETIYIFLLVTVHSFLNAQEVQFLNANWICKNINEIPYSGEEISTIGLVDKNSWIPATVPGTVLTTLINHGIFGDPFFGMNNALIPDISETGNDYYTYWFVNEFKINDIKKDEQFWLQLRGVNYGAEIYLNGKKLNKNTHYGMFLRQFYNISALINKNGKNCLAILVLPPNPVGDANGGQGGDGTIARNVMHQYVAGWDWIQPIADRNTGIWDKVSLERTVSVNLKNPHVITIVNGKRFPGETLHILT
jgi:hypothetical protein